MKIAVASEKDIVTGHFGHCENFNIFQTENNKINVELTVVLEYGDRIQMVCENIMELVDYDIKQKTGIDVDEINILVQDMKLPDEEK